jgi:YihY family inner membrane protein
VSFPADQIRRFDRFQTRFRPVGFIVAIIKKYADDRGPNMGALLAYHAFVAVTPLLLIFFSALSFVLRHDASLQRSIARSALSDFPVLGNSLASPHLHGSVPLVVVGTVVAIWGATGISRSFQNSMADIWNVPGRERPDFIPRFVRGLWFLSLLVVGVAGTAAINGVESALKLGSRTTWLLFIPTAGVSILIIAVAYRVLTPAQRRWREHLPGAIVAGIGYQLLQTLGVSLVTHEAKRAGEFYQTFGVVVGFLAFAYIAGQLIILSAEMNVVIFQHLWPRNLWQPPFTDADRRQLIQLALREERVPEQMVHVEFLPEEPPPGTNHAQAPGTLPDLDNRARGGTVDTAGLNPAAHGHEGSNPSAPTVFAPQKPRSEARYERTDPLWAANGPQDFARPTDHSSPRPPGTDSRGASPPSDLGGRSPAPPRTQEAQRDHAKRSEVEGPGPV